MDTGPLDIRNIYESNTDTMKFKDFKNYVYHIEHEALAAYNKLCRQDTKNTRPTLDIIHLETSLEDRLHNIETILTDTETSRGVAQQRGYIKRTNKLIEEVKTTLLDIEATHGFDIALWDSLHHAIYNLDMILTSTAYQT